jgi:hypothetical protein
MAKGMSLFPLSLYYPWELPLTLFSFVEFETAADLRTAVEKLDRLEFKGAHVSCVADVCISRSAAAETPADDNVGSRRASS